MVCIHDSVFFVMKCLYLRDLIRRSTCAFKEESPLPPPPFVPISRGSFGEICFLKGGKVDEVNLVSFLNRTP